MASLTFKALLRIIDISHEKALSFQEKLSSILDEMLLCMNIEKGSIMLLRRNRTLEVVVSTNPDLVGVIQSVEEDTPSSWVVRNKRALYVGPDSKDVPFSKRYLHYKKDAFLLAPIISGNKVIGVLSITDKKGEDAFNAEEQEFLLTVAGQVISAIENRHLTESLKKSRDDIKQKNIELKNLERIRTELFNMLIHDLKGPLSEIVANLDILTYTTANDNLEYVNTAQSACDTLFRMITDLLDITRIEEGCLNLVYESINAAELVHEAVIRLSSMTKTRGIELRENISAGIGAVAFSGDRGLLLRILQNLITNAVQHSPAGEHIELGFEQEGSAVVFFVQDSGPGIAPEYQEAIFHKFFQITKKRDGRRYSTGLGLTFCKMAVEAHQGTIRVESDGVKGSRFLFSVPLTMKKSPVKKNPQRKSKKKA